MPAQIQFACPICHAALEHSAADELSCAGDGLRFARVEGIWRFLLPGRLEYFEKFMREYETIRRAEGRGSETAAYYRALPYRDLSGKMPGDWRIRAASFDELLKKVLAPLEQPGQALRVLDLGAGNGWLSNRLAGRGHQLAAVDLMTNAFDGLACRRHYETDFCTIQAEFERLPFQDGGSDLVIFNASLHYSINIRATLAEALRTLDRNGKLVILDSPVYREPGSGQKMVRERESQFLERFGFASNSLASENYLTYQSLRELESALSIRWQFFTPFYGLGWLLRPLKAKLRAGREPAEFHLLVAGRV